MKYCLLFLTLFVQVNASGYADYTPTENCVQQILNDENCERRERECPFRYQGQYEDAETGLYYNRFRYYDPSSGSYLSQGPIGLEGNNSTLYAYVHDPNSWVDIFGLTGIVYLRTRTVNGVTKSYVGKSKSPEAFQKRQYSHNRALQKATGDPTAKYDFDKLGSGIEGKDNLAFAEETEIRKRGGIDTLDNKISAMNDKKFKEMGGDIDKKGNKLKAGCH